MGIREFFQTILWGATLQVAAIRIALASILWSLISVILGNTTAAEFFPQVFMFLFLLTAFIAIAIPATGLARANVPFVGLAALPAWLVAVADPLVKLIHAKKPEFIPVDEFKLINPPVLAVFAIDEQHQSRDGRTSQIAEEENQDSYRQEINEQPGIKPQYDDIRSIDVGTPEERYKRAGDLWDTKEEAAQQTALEIYERLTSENVEFAGPYNILAIILSMTDAAQNSEKILSLTRRLVEIEPENDDYKERLQYALFSHAHACWDRDDSVNAFDNYLEGLHIFSRRGQVLTQQSPAAARIAFLACRMFSKNSLKRGNAEPGTLFFDWCEAAGIDPNADFDIEDARP